MRVYRHAYVHVDGHVYRHMCRHVSMQGWKDWNGNLLTPESVTLYDCNTYVIKPATIHQRCSYVELVGETAAHQMPKWFVSHWCARELPSTHQFKMSPPPTAR